MALAVMALALAALCEHQSATPAPPTTARATHAPNRAEQPDTSFELPEGTRAIAIKVAKDQEVLNGAVPGTSIDVVGEVSDPSEIGNVILDVMLLAVDSQDTVQQAEKEILVTVALTTAQVDAIKQMQQQGAKLSIRLHAKEKPQQ
jgi:Flp pilus assembly protein CpaB